MIVGDDRVEVRVWPFDAASTITHKRRSRDEGARLDLMPPFDRTCQEYAQFFGKKRTCNESVEIAAKIRRFKRIKTDENCRNEFLFFVTMTWKIQNSI